VAVFETIHRHVLTHWSPNYSCKLKESGPDKFSMKPLIFQVQKQPLDYTNLGKTNIKHGKITCQFQLDIGPGIAHSAVESNSTLDL